MTTTGEPAFDLAAAVSHFRARLTYETDVSDVAAAMLEQPASFVLVDSRSRESWDQGHIPGALHLPTQEIHDRAAVEIPAGLPVVTYCWGPGCNGATRAALSFNLLGVPAREMLGGFEYWAREGFAVETADGTLTQPVPDPLTVACGC